MSSPSSRRPTVAVVIPCFNGSSTLGRQLTALQRQHDAQLNLEIVVADNRSTDDLASVLQAFEGSPVPVRRVMASDRPGINHARNAGVRATDSDLLLFCDADDCVWPGWVKAFVDALTAGAELVGGPVQAVTSAGRPWGPGPETDFVNDLEFKPWPTGANCGFLRTVWDEVGPFDESFLGGGDETDFFWKAQLAGHSLTFVSDAVIDYTQRDSVSDLYRQNRAYGRSHVRLFERYGSKGMPRSSSVRGAVWWASLPIRALAALLIPARRGALVRDVGWRAGRALESMRSRTIYL